MENAQAIWLNGDDDAPDLAARQRELDDVRRRIQIASRTLAQSSANLRGLEAQTAATGTGVSAPAFLTGLVLAIPFWTAVIWFLAWVSR